MYSNKIHNQINLNIRNFLQNELTVYIIIHLLTNGFVKYITHFSKGYKFQAFVGDNTQNIRVSLLTAPFYISKHNCGYLT